MLKSMHGTIETSMFSNCFHPWTRGEMEAAGLENGDARSQHSAGTGGRPGRVEPAAGGFGPDSFPLTCCLVRCVAQPRSPRLETGPTLSTSCLSVCWSTGCGGVPHPQRSSVCVCRVSRARARSAPRPRRSLLWRAASVEMPPAGLDSWVEC